MIIHFINSDKVVTLIIEPMNVNIYLPNRNMKITCQVTPEEVVNNSLIVDIKFIFNNSTFQLSGLREITIDGRNVGKICVQCGHLILDTVTKCYDYYGILTLHYFFFFIGH